MLHVYGTRPDHATTETILVVRYKQAQCSSWRKIRFYSSQRTGKQKQEWTQDDLYAYGTDIVG